jgi:hypothetical protein
MTADIIALSELSDEPVEQPAGLGYAFSDRLEAIWDRLPKTRQGQKARIRTWLARAGIDSVAKLVAMDRYAATGLGPASLAAIDAALACFGLHRVDVNAPVVVRDGATAAEAHVQRLLKWASERLAVCEALNKERVGECGHSMRTTETDVLADVMLILDGREPTNKRRWGT